MLINSTRDIKGHIKIDIREALMNSEIKRHKKTPLRK